MSDRDNGKDILGGEQQERAVSESPEFDGAIMCPSCRKPLRFCIRNIYDPESHFIYAVLFCTNPGCGTFLQASLLGKGQPAAADAGASRGEHSGLIKPPFA
jgi:hypothetical protein